MNSDQKKRQYLLFALLLVVSSLLAVLGYRGVHQDIILLNKGEQSLTKQDFKSAIPTSAESSNQESSSPQVLKSYKPVETQPIKSSTVIVVKKPVRPAERANVVKSMSAPENHEDMVKERQQQPHTKTVDATELQRAENFMVRKEYGQAEAIYRDYLERHVDDLKVRLKLAEILSWEKNYDASLAEYERILKARPDDIQVRRKYSNVLIWSGKIDEAAHELRKTLE